MIQIFINGQEKTIPTGQSVFDVLMGLELVDNGMELKRGFAVCLNQTVLPRRMHAAQVLKAADKLEIIRPVGGG